MDRAEPERLLAGRYRLRTVIGRGGMGVVWRARDELLARDVAVKEIIWPAHMDPAEWDVARQRAQREAQMAARLSHPNVVGIYDVVTEDDRPWIIMELVPYRSLRDRVQADGPLAPGQAAHVGLGILAALRAAHQAGVLHRDVKPANVLIASEGRVVLTDFGIARATDSPVLTGTGVLVGSPSYISPERARGGQASAPADLWALGACLYAAVEGRPPFDREGALASLTAVVTDEPDPPVHAGPLWPVISGLLRKDPDQRLRASEAEGMLRRLAESGAPPDTDPADGSAGSGADWPVEDSEAAGFGEGAEPEEPAASRNGAAGAVAGGGLAAVGLGAAGSREAAAGESRAAEVDAPEPSEPSTAEAHDAAEAGEPEAVEELDAAQASEPGTAGAADAGDVGEPSTAGTTGAAQADEVGALGSVGAAGAGTRDRRPGSPPTGPLPTAGDTEDRAAGPEVAALPAAADAGRAASPEDAGAGAPAAALPAADAGPAAAERGRNHGQARKRILLAVSAAAVVVAAVVAGLVLTWHGSAGSSGHPQAAPPAASHSASSRPTSRASASARPSARPSASPSASPSPSASASGGSSAVPAGYYRFTNSTGFSIGVPNGWLISHQGNYVYIRDPADSGIFLLIDQSDQPQPNALADWKQQAAARQGSYPGYHLLKLQAVSYPQAEQAADWEFTYNRDGVPVHILNRNVLANASHAYALYWSTPDSDWNADYHYFQTFAASFRPAA